MFGNAVTPKDGAKHELLFNKLTTGTNTKTSEKYNCGQPLQWGTTFVESHLFNDKALVEDKTFICNRTGKAVVGKQRSIEKKRVRENGERVRDWA
jgi:hypothetical protein